MGLRVVAISIAVVACLVAGNGLSDDASLAVAAPQTRVYRVPSPSMEPAFQTGNLVGYDPAAYRDGTPRIGDVVIFHPPAGADLERCGNPRQGLGRPVPCGTPVPRTSTRELFIKRVVGLPGDLIALRHGRLIRNEPFIRACPSRQADCDFPRAVRVPLGHYFLAGDNRAHSDDSRFYGPVPTSTLLGKVISRLG